MQIAPVSFSPVVQARPEHEALANKSVELAGESSFSAIQEIEETQSSGRQSEQKPEGGLPSETKTSDQEVQFSDEELKILKNLEVRDREVRNHEQAHKSAGGQHAGSISFTYQRGPDGANYAVGGEVPISVSPVAGDPQATIDKAGVIRRAALAPAEPSAQDRSVAAQASQIKIEAQAELVQQEVDAKVEKEEADKQAESSAQKTEASEEAKTEDESVVGENASVAQASNVDSNTTPDINISDGKLSADEFVHLLASDIARKAALAVFEDISAQTSANTDESVSIRLDEIA